MPFISTKEFNERISSPKNFTSQMEVLKMGKGRSLGRENVEPEIRKLIAGLATDPSNDDTGKSIAKAFDVMPSQVTAYKSGRTTPSKSAALNDELVSVVNGNKVKKADIEMKALDLIAAEFADLPSKMAEIKTAKGKTNVLKDITTIMNGVNGKVGGGGSSESNQNNQINLHLYAPRTKEISEYEVVEAGK